MLNKCGFCSSTAAITIITFVMGPRSKARACPILNLENLVRGGTLRTRYMAAAKMGPERQHGTWLGWMGTQMPGGRTEEGRGTEGPHSGGEPASEYSFQTHHVTGRAGDRLQESGIFLVFIQQKS